MAEKRNVGKLAIRPDHPRCRNAMWICMCGHIRELVIYPSLFTRKLVAVSNKKHKRTNNQHKEELTQCYKLAKVTTQYARQLASAMNNIWLILVKYAIQLGDCTMFKQQT